MSWRARAREGRAPFLLRVMLRAFQTSRPDGDGGPRKTGKIYCHEKSREGAACALVSVCVHLHMQPALAACSVVLDYCVLVVEEVA